VLFLGMLHVRKPGVNAVYLDRHQLMTCVLDCSGGKAPDWKKHLPVVSKRMPGLGGSFVVSVLLAVFGAHVVQGQGDGGLAGPEVVIGRGLPRTRLGAACSTV